MTEDRAEGRRLKEAGIALASGNRRSLLEFAQAIAVELAARRPDRRVTADDVQLKLEQLGVPAGALGNAAGGLFRSKAWEFTGQFTESRRPRRHCNLLRVWQLKGGA